MEIKIQPGVLSSQKTSMVYYVQGRKYNATGMRCSITSFKSKKSASITIFNWNQLEEIQNEIQNIMQKRYPNYVVTIGSVFLVFNCDKKSSRCIEGENCEGNPCGNSLINILHVQKINESKPIDIYGPTVNFGVNWEKHYRNNWKNGNSNIEILHGEVRIRYLSSGIVDSLQPGSTLEIKITFEINRFVIYKHLPSAIDNIPDIKTMKKVEKKTQPQKRRNREDALPSKKIKSPPPELESPESPDPETESDFEITDDMN